MRTTWAATTAPATCRNLRPSRMIDCRASTMYRATPTTTTKSTLARRILCLTRAQRRQAVSAVNVYVTMQIRKPIARAMAICCCATPERLAAVNSRHCRHLTRRLSRRAFERHRQCRSARRMSRVRCSATTISSSVSPSLRRYSSSSSSSPCSSASSVVRAASRSPTTNSHFNISNNSNNKCSINNDVIRWHLLDHQQF